MHSIRAASFFALLLAPTLALAGAGGSPFPLEQNWSWSYVGPDEGVMNVQIDGVRQVLGVTTVVRAVTIDAPGDTQTLENYWSVDPAGNVRLHGFTNFTADLVRAYDPPIVYLDVPLVVGNEWSTTTTAYPDLEGNGPAGSPFTVRFTAASQQSLTVPAGTFQAFEIAQVFPASFDVRGRLPSSAERGIEFVDWVTPGVGLIRDHVVNGNYDLSSFGPPVPVRPATWGSVLGRYRSGPGE